MTTYEDVAAELARRIVAGEPAAGGKLSGVRQLAEDHGTSSATAGRALQELARAGVVEVAARRHSVVAADGASRAAAYLRGAAVLRLAGSDDPALARLLAAVPGVADRVGPTGSGAGISALWNGQVEAATLHLRGAAGVYNAPFVARVLADRRPLLVRLWNREQGILIRPGGPIGMSTALAPLVGHRLALRPAGSGTRVLLDQLAREQGVDPSAFSGPVFDSHLDVALGVATGTADAGLGLRSAAELFGLAFVPLTWEPFELALPAAVLPLADELIHALGRPELRRSITALGGYDLDAAGSVAAVRG